MATSYKIQQFFFEDPEDAIAVDDIFYITTPAGGIIAADTYQEALEKIIGLERITLDIRLAEWDDDSGWEGQETEA